MRAFLAFEVAREVTDRLLAAQREMGRIDADLGMVGKQNLHFTVKFLGDIPDSAVEEIDLRLKDLQLRAVELDVKGVGAFPSPGRPRVVWAGVAKGDAGKMEGLSGTVIQALEWVGKPEDHDFHPHITLARVRSPRNGAALEAFIRKNEDSDFGRTAVDRLKLKSSLLTPGGPIYSDVREYALS